jgi:hypothetical protein
MVRENSPVRGGKISLWSEVVYFKTVISKCDFFEVGSRILLVKGDSDPVPCLKIKHPGEMLTDFDPDASAESV